MPVTSDARDAAPRSPGATMWWAIAHITLFGVWWAVYLAISRFLPRGYSIFEVLWGRYALHVALTLVVIGPVQGRALVRTTRPSLQLVRGLLMVVTSVSAVSATAGMSLDGVRAVLWLAPLLVIAADRAVRGTPCRVPVWIACGVCWVGTILILHPSFGRDLQSVCWAVLTAGSFAGYQVLTPNLRCDPATTSVFYSGLITLVPMSVILPWVEPPLPRQGPSHDGAGGSGDLRLPAPRGSSDDHFHPLWRSSRLARDAWVHPNSRRIGSGAPRPRLPPLNARRRASARDREQTRGSRTLPRGGHDSIMAEGSRAASPPDEHRAPRPAAGSGNPDRVRPTSARRTRRPRAGRTASRPSCRRTAESAS
jgi:hypothetical protein